MPKRTIATLVVAVLLTCGSLYAYSWRHKKKKKKEEPAATQQATPRPGEVEIPLPPKPVNLLVWGMVHGKPFVFSVLEPLGWHGDTEKLAIKYKVHIVFIPADKQSLVDGTTVRVRVMYKHSNDMNLQWESDKAAYLKEYPTAQFGDVDVAHPVWTTVAKSVSVDKQFYEDVAYLNSSQDSPFIVACYLTKNNEPFTPAEFTTYQDILHSLHWSKQKAPDDGEPVQTVEPGQQGSSQ